MRSNKIQLEYKNTIKFQPIFCFVDNQHVQYIKDPFEFDNEESFYKEETHDNHGSPYNQESIRNIDTVSENVPNYFDTQHLESPITEIHPYHRHEPIIKRQDSISRSIFNATAIFVQNIRRVIEFKLSTFLGPEISGFLLDGNFVFGFSVLPPIVIVPLTALAFGLLFREDITNLIEYKFFKLCK